MISFYAPGAPQSKGSAKGFYNQKLGRVIITNDNTRAKPWAAVVTLLAREAMAGRAPIEGPVRVQLGFCFQRPKAHFTRRGLRPDAPSLVSKKPDVDKVTRTVLDAITMAAVWGDDAQVAELIVEKRYADQPGVRVLVERAE